MGGGQRYCFLLHAPPSQPGWVPHHRHRQSPWWITLGSACTRRSPGAACAIMIMRRHLHEYRRQYRNRTLCALAAVAAVARDEPVQLAERLVLLRGMVAGNLSHLVLRCPALAATPKSQLLLAAEKARLCCAPRTPCGLSSGVGGVHGRAREWAKTPCRLRRVPRSQVQRQQDDGGGAPTPGGVSALLLDQRLMDALDLSPSLF